MTTHELRFETPRRNQGQIVTYSYATTPSGVAIEQREDASDRSVEYYWCRGGRLTAAELIQYGLVEVAGRTVGTGRR